MPAANFVEALMQAKRVASLHGRPLSKSETAGITSGYAETASERLTRGKSLELQETSIADLRKAQLENLAQRKYETQQQLEAAKEARRTDRNQAIGSAGGAMLGYAAGTYIGASTGAAAGAAGGAAGGAASGVATGSMAGPYGMIAGAFLGAIFGSACIIISACTSRNSYEANVCREFRDKYLGLDTMAGYYSLASLIAPIIRRNKTVKWLVKRYLVDRLVDYGQVVMGHTKRRKYLTSKLVSILFLNLCQAIGIMSLKEGKLLNG